MPSGTPQTLSCPGPDSRNGLSLACSDCASQRLRHRVKVPGLLLQIPIGFVPARSALWLRYPGRFAPPRPLLRLKPVAGFPPTATGLAWRFHSSSGLLSPSGSTHPHQSSPYVHLPDSPDSLSLPAAIFFYDCRRRITVPGSLRFRRLAVPKSEAKRS